MCVEFPVRECIEDVPLEQFRIPSCYLYQRDYLPFLQDQFLLTDFERYLLEVVLRLLPPSPEHMPDTLVKAIFYFLHCHDLGLNLILINLRATNLAQTL